MFYRSLCFFVLIFLLNDQDTAGRGRGKYTPYADIAGISGYSPFPGQPRSRWIISPYDQILREEGACLGIDWRLLSAIAYNESRFESHVVSPRGARGLMQIMPAVARRYNVTTDQLADPRTNVRLAARIISRIEEQLRFSCTATREDRTRIVLACYNGGIGHILDARRLAVKHGGDPDRWTDVAAYLRLKSDPGYAADEVVQCGSFGGSGQTLAFVDKVMGKYSSYCRKVAR